MLGVAVLCEVGPEAAQVPRLPDPLDRRARHVWEENARVIQAVASLGTGDVRALADLMRASHASQRDLFEVSTPEVDHLVERAEGAGALAARLTGGGFGGAVVALCRPGESALVAERAGAVLLAVAQPK
jgi:galactokinase